MTDIDRTAERTALLLRAAVAGLDPTDRAERINHCRTTGQHGIRSHTDQHGVIEFRWGGRLLAVIHTDLLDSDHPIGAHFTPSEVPDHLPPEWQQPR